MVTNEAYAAYLLTPEWHARAEACKARAGYRCQLCYADGELHAHHRTYERLGAEHPMDLTALCGDCHAKFHNKPPDWAVLRKAIRHAITADDLRRWREAVRRYLESRGLVA